HRLGLHRKVGIFLWSLLLVLVLVVLFHPLWLTALGEFLVVSTPLEPADVVVVMGGGGTHRVNQGMELYRRGFSRSGKLIITGGPLDTDIFAEGTWAALGGKYAMSKGMPREGLILADWTESTYDDVQAVKNVMQEKGFRSAILVSDIFHMRRTMWLMGKVMPGVKFMASPAPAPLLRVDRWWTRERESLFVFQEYIKVILYLRAYGL
ncbi:MAG: YdcF family protein, partial [Dehalococcoidia bacterium]|nr:YdcF family protein [Dehalococcoidia bacterium]